MPSCEHTRPLPGINAAKGWRCINCKSEVYFLESRCPDCRIFLSAGRKVEKKIVRSLRTRDKAKLLFESKVRMAMESVHRRAFVVYRGVASLFEKRTHKRTRYVSEHKSQ